jgi:glucokinase
MSRTTFNLGIEIGGTKLQVVRGDLQGQVQHRWRRSVERQDGANGIRHQLASVLKECLDHFGPPHAIGVGFGGPVDRQTGSIACSHQIEGWSGFALRDWLQDILRAPVILDNDANVAALGEARFGAGRSHNPVFYVTLGSGVGGGMVVQNQIYHGAPPGEAEIGHVRLNRQGATIESRCSGWAVNRKLSEFGATHPASPLAQRIHACPGAESICLGAALADDDADARHILTETAEDLAFGLSHVVQLFHPAVIVLGGGLSLIGEPLRLAVEQALKPWIMDIFAPGPAIKLAELGEDAVPIGALALAG